MASEPTARRRKPAAPEEDHHERTAREADVIVDVEFSAGLLFLVVSNLGDAPAHAVRVKFEPPFRGLGGSRRVSALALFRRLEFLAPRGSIRVFLDRAALYFARDEPTRVEASIAWRTDDGRRRSRVVRHDLEIYRDLPYVESEVSG